METMEQLNSEIKETTDKLIGLVAKAIKHDMKDFHNPSLMVVLPTMLMAHNMWQEDTNDGVDYIFDITNKQDVICLLQGDLTVNAIASLYNGQQSQLYTRYFRYGQNYELPTPFKTMEEITEYLADNALWIITHLFLFRNETKECKTIFNLYIGKLFNA